MAETLNESPALPTSLWQLLADGANKNERRLAITVMHQPADHFAMLTPNAKDHNQGPWLSWTYGELKHASVRLAAGMQKAGVERGSTIATLIPNGIECYLVLWVSAILQLTLAPLDPGLVDSGREDQLKDYMAGISPQTVLVVGFPAAEALDKTMKECGIAFKVSLMLEQAAVPPWTSLSDVAATTIADELDDAGLAQDTALYDSGARVAAILFTSGTSSGRPKGCPLRVRNLLNCLVNDCAFVEFPSSINMQNVNFRVIWLCVSLTAFRNGSHVVMPSQAFSVTSALDAIEHGKAELLICITPQIQAFAKELSMRNRDLHSLRYVLAGGDMVTVDAVAKAQECFPQARILTAHGMTEGTGVLGWLGHDPGPSIPEHHGIISVGIPAPGTLVRICDEESRVVSRGEIGELHLGGQSVIDHYLGNEQAQSFYCDDQGSWVSLKHRRPLNRSLALLQTIY